jgi:hypothetical protein
MKGSYPRDILTGMYGSLGHGPVSIERMEKDYVVSDTSYGMRKVVSEMYAHGIVEAMGRSKSCIGRHIVPLKIRLSEGVDEGFLSKVADMGYESKCPAPEDVDGSALLITVSKMPQPFSDRDVYEQIVGSGGSVKEATGATLELGSMYRRGFLEATTSHLRSAAGEMYRRRTYRVRREVLRKIS